MILWKGGSMSNYVIVDLEMCKVNSKDTELHHEIIQIGSVLLDETFQIKEEFMTYVSPQYGQIDRFIEDLTGISRDDVKNAPDFNEAIHKWVNWLPKEAILVSWSDTDYFQIDDELFYKEIDYPEFDDYLDHWEDCQVTFSEKMGISRRYRLSEALNLCEVYTELGEHDALVDARNTARLFAKMMNEKELKFNDYYAKTDETVNHTTYNPFADLLKDYK